MDKEDAFTYYKLIRDEEKFWLDIHHKYSQQYLTLISAIFAISIGALYQLKNEPLLVLVLIAPLLNIILCVTARKMCDQIYKFFLEGVAIQKKLVPLIGLDNQRKRNLGKTYLFSLKPENKEYLKDDTVNDDIKKAFENNNLNLSSDAVISKTKDKCWVINDGTKKYRVEEAKSQIHEKGRFRLLRRIRTWWISITRRGSKDTGNKPNI